MPDDDDIDFTPKKQDEAVFIPDETEDISFSPKKGDGDVHSKIDEELFKIRDKVKIIDDIKTNPPPPGAVGVTLEKGVHEIDLSTLLSSQIVDCPGTVIPMLIDHGVRTAVDIKDTYKPERR